MAFAAHNFAMQRREKDGRSTREHLMVAAKRSAKARRDLIGPPLPREWAGVWRWFVGLDRWRGAGAMAMAPLTLSDLEAWERRTGVTLTEHEADVVKRLDITRMNASA